MAGPANPWSQAGVGGAEDMSQDENQPPALLHSASQDTQGDLEAGLL